MTNDPTSKSPADIPALVRELMEFQCSPDDASWVIDDGCDSCDECHLEEEKMWCPWHEANYEKLHSFNAVAEYLLSQEQQIAELRKKVACESCGADKQCVSYQCCDHPIDWFYMKGFTTAMCPVCMGTAENPEYKEGEKTWMQEVKDRDQQIQELEEKLRIAIDRLKTDKDIFEIHARNGLKPFEFSLRKVEETLAILTPPTP